MSKRSRSEVWKFYTELPCGRKVKCTLCSAEISRGGSGKAGSSSALKNHLSRKHPQESKQVTEIAETEVIKTANVAQIQMKQQTLMEVTEKMNKWAISDRRAQEFHYLIGEMLVLDNLPFLTVENQGFRRLMAKAAKNYNVPSRTFFSTNIIPDMYEKCVAKLKTILAAATYVSLTTDIWTCSHNNDSFISLTAHWITANFKQKSAMLHCKHFPMSHTGENIRDIFYKMFEEWHLETSTIHLVVRDNAKNMVKGCNDAQLKSISCFIHTLQLVINDGLSSQRALSDLIATCRKIVGHFSHSSSAVQKLKAIQKELDMPENKLVQDVPTRWNSTFYMLQRLLEQKRAVNVYASENDTSLSVLSSNQWNLLSSLINLLKPFEQITKEMSSEVALISQVIPVVQTLEKFLSQTSQNFFGVGTLKDFFLADLKKRFGSLIDDELYIVATILDPRFKIAFLQHKTSEFWEQYIVDIYKNFENFQSPESQESTSSEKNVTPNATSEEGTTCNDLWQCFNELATQKTSRTPTDDNADNLIILREIQQYLQMPSLKRQEDPLLWWEKNQTCFPSLKNMVKKYLSAPATSVYSERLFSEAGNIYEEARSRLLPQNGEKLIFLHHNLKKLDFDYQ